MLDRDEKAHTQKPREFKNELYDGSRWNTQTQYEIKNYQIKSSRRRIENERNRKESLLHLYVKSML